MRSTRLQGLAVLHQKPRWYSIYRAGKAFRLRLDTLNNWHAITFSANQHIHSAFFLRLSLNLLISFVSSVPPATEIRQCGEERTGTHLPANTLPTGLQRIGRSR